MATSSHIRQPIQNLLSVPMSTPIISNLPDKDYLAVWEQYQRNREIALKEYIAIITHEDQNLNGAVTMVDIDYRSNRKHRLERHFVFNAGEGIDKFWPEHQRQLGDSFKSLRMWTQSHYDTKGSISIYLYDGDYDTSTRRNNGQWSNLRKHYSPDGEMLPNIALEDIAWPTTYGKTGKIIEDDFSKEHHYICVERLQQGSILHDGHVSPPGRCLYYLDPAKNYMCIRYVIEWNPGAEWQEDKHWLDSIAREKIGDGSITVTDITETVQAENGIWYPKLITEQQTGVCKDYKDKPLKQTYFKKVYIQTNPEFPEGLFDLGVLKDTLIVSGDVSSQKKNVSIFNKVDQSNYWPPAKELVRIYWEARNQKDYKTTRLYWPSSEVWDEETFEKELSVEYVFGLPKSINDTYVHVPYDTKKYYEQNNQYRFNMVLSNEHSEKGRYYIFSGN